MTVGMKLTGVFLFLAALITFSGYEGHNGIVRLGEVLDRVSGPAWDTADGMADIRIAVCEEGLLVQRAVTASSAEVLQNDGRVAAVQAIAGLDDTIRQRFERIEGTGLFQGADLRELRERMTAFQTSRDRFLESDLAFDSSENSLRQSFSNFQGFMRSLLDYVEEERERDRAGGDESLGGGGEDLLGVLGNIGSQMATESALDTYVSLLELNYRYQLFGAVSRSRDEKGSQEVGEDLRQARSRLQARVQNLGIQDIFDTPSGLEGGGTWSQGVVTRNQELIASLDQASADLVAFDQAQLAYQEAMELLTRGVERMEEIGDSKVEGETRSIEEANQAARKGILLSLLIGALAVGAAIVYVFLYIARPLRRVSLAMSAFAEGKVDVEIPEGADGSDEIAELIGVLQTLIKRLNGRQESFRQLSMEHASSVRETVATVRELRETAILAQRIASDTLSQADDGLVAGKEGAKANNLTREGLLKLARRVDGMSETIAGLTEKIKQIGKIAGTVNDLSEQSKFLSLNAAIEAARAGEHGRGFGVVAVEVRMLAQQSQEASLEISRLITEISERAGEALSVAEEGRREARDGEEVLLETEGAISRLSEALRSSHEASNKLLASSNQQAVGVDQIAQAMEEIDSTVERILSAAEVR